MVHALQSGKISGKQVSSRVRQMARKINPESVGHFARTSHDNLPEKKTDKDTGQKKEARALVLKLGVYQRLLKHAFGL